MTLVILPGTMMVMGDGRFHLGHRMRRLRGYEVENGYRQVRSWRSIVTAGLMACLALGAGGCVRDGYAGISLEPGGAPADLQRLAERAMTGDKQAQLDLGERYEEGHGVIPDRKRARQLYRQAATTTGGTIFVYVPPAKKGGQGYTMPVNTGPVVQGLSEAKERLRALKSAPPVPGATSDVRDPDLAEITEAYVDFVSQPCADAIDVCDEPYLLGLRPSQVKPEGCNKVSVSKTICVFRAWPVGDPPVRCRALFDLTMSDVAIRWSLNRGDWRKGKRQSIRCEVAQ